MQTDTCCYGILGSSESDRQDCNQIDTTMTDSEKYKEIHSTQFLLYEKSEV